MHQLVFSGHTGQHPVLVTDEDNLRSLRFGTDERQSCINLLAPWELQLAYTQWMTSALLLHPGPEKFLLFGLGGGALPHFLLHYHAEAQVDVVEKEAQVIALAHDYFKLPQRDTLRILNQDAEGFLRTAESSDYHIAFLDIFGPGAMAPALFQPELYRDILARLTPDGVLAVNLWDGDKQLYHQALEAVREGSAGQVMQMQVKRRSNVILLVFPSEIPHKRIKMAQKNSPHYQQRYHLDYPQFIKRLRRTNRASFLTSLFR
ncbi:MAG: fused MFS/spermidine synthase [Desulfobulbaceae bacterium]|jgi:spermidine synthase|nr:fused MFS/spermidine synthase [Desulfobulbaceae bacterium]